MEVKETALISKIWRDGTSNKTESNIMTHIYGTTGSMNTEDGDNY